MKTILASIVIAFALACSVQAAEVTAKLSNVHLCCKKCVTGVEKAVAGVEGVKASADQDDGTVGLTGPDTATVQKAVDALVGAGYFGTTSDAGVKLDSSTGAKGEKVQSLQVSGVHLCCGSCVKAVQAALKTVPGVKGDTAVKGAKTFEVTGDFNDKDVFVALQKAGLTGKAGM
ncbi:MAG: putative metal-binding protein [Pedosphaera sp.]|nr:putative metal-binding protein [Pedosphaera sp.]